MSDREAHNEPTIAQDDLSGQDDSMLPPSLDVNGRVKLRRTEVKKSGLGLALLSFQTLGASQIDTVQGKKFF